MAQCPSCQKFAGLELQDPEVNEVSLDEESQTVSVEVRIVRNSECCGDEMKEYTFNTDQELPADLVAKMEAIKKEHPDAEFDAQEGGVDQLEEGGHRYKKSYYGYTLTADINSIVDGKTQTIGSVEVTDKIEASGMDELN
jgi:hypothetical protein